MRPDPKAGRRRVGIALLGLLCNLSQGPETDEVALGILLSLLEQLPATRKDLAQMARAIDALPEDLQARIAAGRRL